MANFTPFRDLVIFARNRSRAPRHIVILLSFAIFSTLSLWYMFAVEITEPEIWEALPDERLAPRIWPQHVLSQNIASGPELYAMPKYIHQSWMSDQLPQKMSRWSQTCRAINSHWQWVLWTDEDNLKMVETYFPWFLETYRALPAEINRADVSRSMYMYMFGGIYADLDTECLRPFDELLDNHDIKLLDQTTLQVPPELPPTVSGSHAALFGRMGFDGTDDTLQHTIPNAWMAATPGHPFFLIVLEALQAAVAANKNDQYDTSAEVLTGPIALYRAIETYDEMKKNGTSLSAHFIDNPSYQLFQRPSTDVRMGLLPPENIYPYAWNNYGMKYRGVCWAGGKDFNSVKCKKGVTTSETYTITYWSHTWNADLHKTHDEYTMNAISKGQDDQ